MKLPSLFTYLFSLILLASTCSAASQRLEKRATQVSLISYTFSSNVLAGSIKIQNIAYAKVVKVYYSVGSTWSDSAQVITAVYSSGPTDDYETWTFSGTATGATQFYIKYDVSGSSYYDPGNNVNYQIPTTTTSAAPTQCTVTSWVTMTAS